LPFAVFILRANVTESLVPRRCTCAANICLAHYRWHEVTCLVCEYKLLFLDVISVQYIRIKLTHRG
jgi:hypothetical protein